MLITPFSCWDSLRQCLESEDDLQQLQSDGVPAEVTDWLASTFTRRVRRPVRRSDEKPKFRSIVHAVQAGIFVERWKGIFISCTLVGHFSSLSIAAAAVSWSVLLMTLRSDKWLECLFQWNQIVNKWWLCFNVPLTSTHCYNRSLREHNWAGLWNISLHVLFSFKHPSNRDRQDFYKHP